MRDLFGDSRPTKSTRRTTKRDKPPATAGAVTKATPPPRVDCPAGEPRRPDLDANTIASYRALGAAVCLESPAGVVWLVPAYTDEARPEISAADLVKVAIVRAAFPGSRIASFTPHTDMALGASPESSISAARRSK